MDRYDVVVVGGSFGGLSAPMQLDRAQRSVLLVDAGRSRNRFAAASHAPTADEAALLGARGVEIERTPVVELVGEGSSICSLVLADGRKVPAEVVFTAPRPQMASPLAGQLGCAFADGMTGAYIQVDPMQQTSVPGVFAAGGAATEMYNATLASAAGVMAGVAAHRALVMESAHGGRDRP